MFAIVEPERIDDPAAILVLLDCREEAEGIALELRQHGRDVVVRRWEERPGRR